MVVAADLGILRDRLPSCPPACLLPSWLPPACSTVRLRSRCSRPGPAASATTWWTCGGTRWASARGGVRWDEWLAGGAAARRTWGCLAGARPAGATTSSNPAHLHRRRTKTWPTWQTVHADEFAVASPPRRSPTRMWPTWRTRSRNDASWRRAAAWRPGAPRRAPRVGRGGVSGAVCERRCAARLACMRSPTPVPAAPLFFTDRVLPQLDDRGGQAGARRLAGLGVRGCAVGGWVGGRLIGWLLLSWACFDWAGCT